MLLISYKKERLSLVLKSIVFGTILLGARLFLTNGVLMYYNVRLVDGFNANYLGMYGAISANIALYYIFNASKKNSRYIYGICLILTTIITILSFSRKAIIFYGLPMLLYYIFHDRSPRKILRRLLVSVGIIAINENKSLPS